MPTPQDVELDVCPLKNGCPPLPIGLACRLPRGHDGPHSNAGRQWRSGMLDTSMVFADGQGGVIALPGEAGTAGQHINALAAERDALQRRIAALERVLTDLLYAVSRVGEWSPDTRVGMAVDAADAVLDGMPQEGTDR